MIIDKFMKEYISKNSTMIDWRWKVFGMLVVIILLVVMIYYISYETFTVRAKYVYDNMATRVNQGLPITYQEYKTTIIDGDPTEFNSVREAASQRNPRLLLQLL
jgi:hypothetical protein